MTGHTAIRRLVARALACVLLLVLVVAVPVPAANAQAVRATWAWPLIGPRAVVRGFQLPPEPWLAGHRGVDLRGSPGDPVLAAGPGRVSFAGAVAGKPVVVVTHSGGLRTTYEPVIAVVTPGDEVFAGSVIGRLSAAGSHCPPAACVHWGLRRGVTYLDPLVLVGATARVRLLPVWSRAPALRSRPPAAHLFSAARVGALNRVRALAGSGP
jgi:murein DD-endopeptidase MepM/ murein hydrolase activator NlpD